TLAAVPKLLNQERQESGPGLKWIWQYVLRMKVTELSENRDHFVMKTDCRNSTKPIPEKFQALHRVHGIHRPLKREVHIELFDDKQGLLYDQLALSQAKTFDSS